MKAIRDPIHGYIELGELPLSLLDTKEVQRLRRIRQLGLSHFVYPGANHTRFEHSLGVMHLAKYMAAHVEEKYRDELVAAALLHDVGHGPLSHVTEELMVRYARRRHYDTEDILRGGEVSDVLRDFSLQPSSVSRHIRGETHVGQILNSEIDVDRMDYLVRDSHYTGVAFGLVDHIRLLHELRFEGDRLVLGQGGIQAAESLLVSRFLMHPTVYYHHVSRIAESMCVRAAEHMIEAGELDPAGLQQMDDCEFDLHMQSSKLKYVKEISKRLLSRRLFKRALYTDMGSMDWSVDSNPNNVRRIEAELAEAADVEPEYVLADIPKIPEIPEMKAGVEIKGKVVGLDAVSRLVGTIAQAHRDNWRLGVYTIPEYREAVGKAAREFFKVRRETRQFSLAEL